MIQEKINKLIPFISENFITYPLCEAKLSIGIASAFFFLSVFVLNNYFITDDKLNNNE